MSFDPNSNSTNTDNTPFVDVDRMRTIANACESFEEIPPELAEIASDNEPLKYLAENIHVICSGSGDVKFTAEDRKTFEIAIRNFVFQASSKSTNEPTDDREQANQARQLTQQLSEAKEQLRNAEESNLKLIQQNKELQERLDTASQESKDYFEKLTQNDAKVTNIRRENSQIQNKLKSEIEQLKDDIQELKDKLKLSEFSVTRLTNSLNSANEELSAAQSELITLKSKAEARSQKMKNAQNQATKMQLKVQEVEAENQRLLTDQNDLVNQLKSMQEELIAAGPENIKRLTDEKEGYKLTVEKLQAFTEKQSNDIVEMRKEQKEATELLRQQIQLVDAYDARYECLSNDYNNLVSQNEALTRNVEDLNQQLASAKQEVEEMSANPNFMTRGLNAEDIEQEASLEELKEQNKRLIGIIENQLRFIQSATVRNIVDCALLSPDSPSDPLLQDGDARDRMLIEIARTRQFLNSNKLEASQMSDKEVKDQVSQLSNSENVRQREAFAVIALQSENNDIIRRYCDKINSKYQAIVSQLSAAAEVINFTGEQEDLAIAIAEKLRAFQAFAKKSQLVLNANYNPADFEETISFLTKYLQQSATILKQIDTDLRAAVKFEGELIDLPFFAVDCINDLLRMISSAKEETVAEMRAQLEQLQREQEEEKEKATEALATLESEGKHKDDIIAELQKQLEQLEQKNIEISNQNRDVDAQRQEAEDKLQKMLANYNDVEADMEAAKEETERIREQMNKKQKAFEERLDMMIEQERQQHSEDLARFEDKLKQREDKLKQELNAKSSKLQQAKAKLKEVIETYDAAFKQQKEATAVLRQQNQELIDRLQQRQEPKNKQTSQVQGPEYEQLKAEIKQLTSEKLMLESKLDQTIANAEQARKLRESYWESQLSQKEEVITRSIQLEQDESEAKVNDFASRIVKALSPYVAADTETDHVVQEAANIAQKLAEAETEIEKLKARKVNQSAIPTRLSDIQRLQQISNALQEWDRWARDLYVNVTEGQIPCQSSKDLRYQLGEMILASIGHRQLIWRLESLRSQKKALTCGVEIPQERQGEKPISTRVLSNYILAAIRIMRKSGHYQSMFD